MRILKWNLSMLMRLLMVTLMIPADTAKLGHDHKRLRKDHRKVQQQSDLTDSQTIEFEETRKKQSHTLDEDAPEYHNYYVSAEMQYKATYRECPPFQKFKCRGSKCMYQSCDKQDEWQEHCSFTPIEECESKNWLCDCDNALGYYRLNSLSTECVHIEDIRCKNANVKCLEDEEKVCPSDDCHEKEYKRAFGVLETKPTCSNDTEKVRNCQKLILCHCKYPLFRREGNCVNSKKLCYYPNLSVCPDDGCKVNECINRNPTSESLCPKYFTEQDLFNCKKPLKCFCNADKPYFYVTKTGFWCTSLTGCDNLKIINKGKYNVIWDYPYH